jgi:Ca2+-binding RTX toxin-like protein
MECGSWGGSTWYIQGYFATGAAWGYWGDLGDDRLFLSSQTTVDVNNNCSAPSSSESYDGNGGAAGEQGNDIVCGSYYGEYLYGGPDTDRVFGFDGDDHLYGGDGGDYMDGGAGADYMEGNDGTNTIIGGSGNDTMVGGANVDYMYGDTGADYLFGGGGSDYMYGTYYGTSDGNCDTMYGGDGAADYCYCGSVANEGREYPGYPSTCETTVHCEGCS